MEQRFGERTLPIDTPTLRVWAHLRAAAELSGQPIAPLHGLLMATAQRHGLPVVTRNVRHFARFDAVFDPWSIPKTD